MNGNTYQFKGTDDYIISDDLMLTMNIAIKMNKPLLSFLIKKDEDLEDVKKSMGGLR